MARKGIRSATVRYMENELEPQVEALQKEIPKLQQEESKIHHLLAMVSTISSRLQLDRSNDPDWNDLMSKYDKIVERLMFVKLKETEIIAEYNLLVDVLDNKFSRKSSRKIIKNSLWKSGNNTLKTTSPSSKGGRTRRHRRAKIAGKRKSRRL